MTSREQDLASPKTNGAADHGAVKRNPDSVFEATPASDPKAAAPTEHAEGHGEDGRENDLDRAEEAGREGGRR